MKNAVQIFKNYLELLDDQVSEYSCSPIYTAPDYVPVGSTVSNMIPPTKYETNPANGKYEKVTTFYTILLEDGNSYVVSLVDSQGGHEGGGEDAYEVYAILECIGDIAGQAKATGTVIGYVKRDGFYSSYEGTEWDNDSFREVTPYHYTSIGWE